MKKSLAILFAAILSVGCLFGCGGDGTTVTPPPDGGDPIEPVDPTPPKPPVTEVVDNKTYDSFWMRNHDYKTMPIAVYNGIPTKTGQYTYDYLQSEQTYIDYSEARVNTLMGLYEGTSNAVTALNFCQKYSLAYLLPMNAEVISSANIKSLIYAKNYDAFAGVMQFDEPGRIQFENLAAGKEKLAEAMPETTTGALWHCNLFPKYAANWQFYYRTRDKWEAAKAQGDDKSVGYTMEQYVDDYLEICDPQVLSYDYYPLSKAFPNLSTGYFENLSINRRKAQNVHIPFWVYIATCKYNNNVRIPACEADVLWQVNTALTYGAKGIQYFTGVVAQSAPEGQGEQFSGAMFDLAGNKTEVYDYVKTANVQLAAADEVLMCSLSKGVIPVGSMPSTEKLLPDDLLESYGLLASATGKHSLIGCFDYKGKNAFYITNNSLTENETLNLTFTQSVNGSVVQKGKKTEFSGSTKQLTFAAGEGVLVVLD
ncbi:MAG: hypothetical protein HFE47_00570 [Clostridia bacterium]|nr:hypothetical protein [Clostridia bacterium]